MFSSLVTVALFAAATLQGVAADPFQISTPGSVTQCQELDLSWSGGSAPFNLIVVPAEDPCADAIQDLGDVNQWTMKWTPKIPAGQKVLLSLIDTTGEEAWSGEISVGGGDSSCVPSNLVPASSSAPPETTTATSSVASSSSVAVTGTTLTLTSSTPPHATGTGSTGSSGSGPVGPVGAVGSDPLSSKNGASHQAAPVMLLGAFAAIAAFVL